MDVIDLVTKIVNLPAIGLLVYYVLSELREQRRELRRARGEDRIVFENVVSMLATLIERVQPPSTPYRVPAGNRSSRHNAPFGVEATVNERPSKRMRSVSDPPDEDDK